MNANIWEELKNDALLEAMRFCGCEEKYIDGIASDFECFVKLFEILDYMDGHPAKERFGAVLGRLGIGLEAAHKKNANAIWSLYCGGTEIDDLFVFDDVDKSKSVEKNNNMIDGVDLNRLIGEAQDYDCLIAEAQRMSSIDGLKIIANFEAKNFEPPNPYAARTAFDECRKTTANIILSQLICEIVSRYNRGKTQLIICGDNVVTYADRLISYLFSHRMLCGVTVCCTPSSSTDELLECCSLGEGDHLVKPMLVVTKNDTDTSVESFKSKLSSVYPIGMLSVVMMGE